MNNINERASLQNYSQILTVKQKMEGGEPTKTQPTKQQTKRERWRVSCSTAAKLIQPNWIPTVLWWWLRTAPAVGISEKGPVRYILKASDPRSIELSLKRSAHKGRRIKGSINSQSVLLVASWLAWVIRRRSNSLSTAVWHMSLGQATCAPKCQ